MTQYIFFRLGKDEFEVSPTFERINTIEEELGSLFYIVHRAVNGRCTFNDIITVVWHCIDRSPFERLDKDQFGDLVLKHGLRNVTPAFRNILKTTLCGTGGN